MEEAKGSITSSESIVEISKALCEVQKGLDHAKKRTENDFFKSKYAELSDVWDVLKKPVTENGIAIWQFPVTDYLNRVEKDVVYSEYVNREKVHKTFQVRVPLVKVITMAVHSSGEYIKSTFTITPNEDTAQSIGSATTYARRYSLSAIFGVCPRDDDGNDASEPPKSPPKVSPPPKTPLPPKAPPKASPTPQLQPQNSKVRDAVGNATKRPLVEIDGVIRWDPAATISKNKITGMLNEVYQNTNGLINTPQFFEILKELKIHCAYQVAKWELWLLNVYEVRFFDITREMYEGILETIRKRPNEIVNYEAKVDEVGPPTNDTPY